MVFKVSWDSCDLEFLHNNKFGTQDLVVLKISLYYCDFELKTPNKFLRVTFKEFVFVIS